jgi:hypothetical protein
MLVGIPIGAIAGPSVALVLFVLIVCYDLGRPRIVEAGQRIVDKYLGIDIGQPSSFFGTEAEAMPVGGSKDRGGLTEEDRDILSQLLSSVNRVSNVVGAGDPPDETVKSTKIGATPRRGVVKKSTKDEDSS